MDVVNGGNNQSRKVHSTMPIREIVEKFEQEERGKFATGMKRIEQFWK
jgi:hypothetical protein